MLSQEIIQQVRGARAAVSEAQEALYQSIRDARSAGLGTVEIAEAAGVTRQRIYQVSPGRGLKKRAPVRKSPSS